jgi:hypothetical protein
LAEKRKDEWLEAKRNSTEEACSPSKEESWQKLEQLRQYFRIKRFPNDQRVQKGGYSLREGTIGYQYG